MFLDHSRITKLITKNQHELALEEMKIFSLQYASEYSIEIMTHQTTLDALENDRRIRSITRNEYIRDITNLTMAMLKLLEKFKTINNELDEVKEEQPKDTININKIEVSGNGVLQIADVLNNFKNKATSILKPDKGIFTVGSTVQIEWISQNQHHYGLYLTEGSNNDVVGTIHHTHFDNLAKTFKWKIPEKIEYKGQKHKIDGERYRIKLVVWNTNNPQIAITSSDFTNSFISIKAK